MALRLEVAQWMTEWVKSDPGRKLLSEFLPERDLAHAVVRLRKSGLDPEQASAIVELQELRQRARAKFEHADQLFFTRRAYEQSSGQNIANWKLKGIQTHFPNAPVVILDLCCGVGGDLIEFSQHYPCIGIDLDPALVHLARTNLQQVQMRSETSAAPAPSLVVSANVLSLLPGDPVQSVRQTTSSKPANGTILADWLPRLPAQARDWAVSHKLLQHLVVWHLDPDRRDDQGRHSNMTKLSPNAEFVAELAKYSGIGILKLAPSTDLDQAWRALAHWQWVGTDRECKQLLGWFGFERSWPPALTSVAVANRDTQEWMFWRSPSTTPTIPSSQAEPLQFLLEPHPAFYAAKMTKAFAFMNNWSELAGSGYFTSDQTRESEDDLCSTFQVLAVLPLRAERIREWLTQNRFVLSEIKSRTVPEKEWKPLLGLRKPASEFYDSQSVSALLFPQKKSSGQAIRVAFCLRWSPSKNR
ncbi:MAG: hypothetical protein JNL67_20360 [Planctomycetaceae bacterium]|nr:hypothetical protein [Planctomycetaceae bacterium]